VGIGVAKAARIFIYEGTPVKQNIALAALSAVGLEILLSKIIKIRFLPLIVLALCSIVSAQTSTKSPARNRQRDAAPRVGTIKDYPATGLMTGCANLYFEFANRTPATSDAYVFLSRSGGENAWMNLDGRDTRLTLLKTTIWHKPDESPRRSRYDYRAGAARISVLIEPRETSGDYTLGMKIILRQGRAVRIVNAVGSSDC
jgi:hypothetical protein